MLRKNKAMVKRDAVIFNESLPFAFKESYRTLRANLN